MGFYYLQGESALVRLTSEFSYLGLLNTSKFHIQFSTSDSTFPSLPRSDFGKKNKLNFASLVPLAPLLAIPQFAIDNHAELLKISA